MLLKTLGTQYIHKLFFQSSEATSAPVGKAVQKKKKKKLHEIIAEKVSKVDILFFCRGGFLVFMYSYILLKLFIKHKSFSKMYEWLLMSYEILIL